MSKVTIRGLHANKNKILKTVAESTKKSMKSAMKDLHRVASETAPYDEGDLEMGGVHDVDKHSRGWQGWVWFEAWNDHPNRSYDFNYAIWIHEETYNLGEKSRMKAGGQGMSGKSYAVGNKFLTRPHEGEAPTYRKLIEQELKKALR